MTTIDGFTEYVSESPASASEFTDVLRNHSEELLAGFTLPIVLVGPGAVVMQVEWFDASTGSPYAVGLLEDGSSIRLEVTEQDGAVDQSVIATTYTKTV